MSRVQTEDLTLIVLFQQMQVIPSPHVRLHTSFCYYFCNEATASITWVTRGSSSLSTARVRISRLLGSHLKLMLAVLMFVMVSGFL